VVQLLQQEFLLGERGPEQQLNALVLGDLPVQRDHFLGQRPKLVLGDGRQAQQDHRAAARVDPAALRAVLVDSPVGLGQLNDADHGVA
jgi:hypothetical protein